MIPQQLNIFEDFEEIAEQLFGSQNTGTRDHSVHGLFKLSPGVLRAKVAREPAPMPVAAQNAPADPPATPEVIPAVPRWITTRAEMVEMFRRRRDELDLTHLELDRLTGWADGYASKLLSPEPLKHFGGDSLDLLLQALALGVARIEFVEDEKLAALMRDRWTKRSRPRFRPRRTRSAIAGALLAQAGVSTVEWTQSETSDAENPFELPPED